jgi:predicted  nucleic acid-binding Zn-ribbon protein
VKSELSAVDKWVNEVQEMRKEHEKEVKATYAKGYRAGLAAAIEAAMKATPRAHTYASENADVYRAWDRGALAAINAIRSLKKGAAK